MPRKPMPWFRCYVETFKDPKIRRLTPAHRWLWTAVLGAARQSVDPPRLMVADRIPMSLDDLADFAALSKAETRKGLAALEAVGIVERCGDVWSVPRWDARQFASDNVTERTRKTRSEEHRRNVPTTPEGTGGERTQRTEDREQIPPPTPSPVDNVTSRDPGGEDPRISEAVAVLAKSLGWNHAAAARKAFTENGTLDHLRSFAARFPTAPAEHLVQMLDRGPLLARYIDEEKRTA